MEIIETILASCDGSVLLLRQTLIEDGLDLSTTIELDPGNAPWLSETLQAFTRCWQTPDLRLQAKEDSLLVFSAGNDQDQRVGIQNERQGKSYSMIVRIGLLKETIRQLALAFPATKTMASQVSIRALPRTSPPKAQCGNDRVTIHWENGGRDVLGDPMEWIELQFRGQAYPGESPAKLLANLKRLRKAIENGGDGNFGSPSGFWPLPGLRVPISSRNWLASIA